MARKTRPNVVVDEFQADLAGSLRTFRQTVGRVRTETLQKQQSIDALLRAAVAFETFRSDWHVAAINRDASTFRRAVDAAVRATVRRDEYYAGADSIVSLNLGRHPSVSVIRTIIDRKGRNVKFSPFPDGWKARAERELSSPYVDRIRNLSQTQLAVLRAVVGVRNAIAHQSPSAVSEMNVALVNLPAGLRRGVNKVQTTGLGSYLWASAPGQPEARVEVFHDRLHDIAEHLRV